MVPVCTYTDGYKAFSEAAPSTAAAVGSRTHCMGCNECGVSVHARLVHPVVYACSACGHTGCCVPQRLLYAVRPYRYNTTQPLGAAILVQHHTASRCASWHGIRCCTTQPLGARHVMAFAAIPQRCAHARCGLLHHKGLCVRVATWHCSKKTRRRCCCTTKGV